MSKEPWCSISEAAVDVLDFCLRDCADPEWIQLFNASRCLGVAIDGWSVFKSYKREEPTTEQEFLQGYFADVYCTESLPNSIFIECYDHFDDLCWDLRREIDSIAGLLVIRMKRQYHGYLYPTVIEFAKGICEQTLRIMQGDLDDELEEDVLRESFARDTLERIRPDAFTYFDSKDLET